MIIGKIDTLIKNHNNRQNIYPYKEYMTTHFPGLVQALQYKKVAGLN
jgi:hypothetical protein